MSATRRSCPVTPVGNNSQCSSLNSSGSIIRSSSDVEPVLATDTRDGVYYLEAIFPYASYDQVVKAIRSSATLDDAAEVLNAELNPRPDDIRYLEDERERCESELSQMGYAAAAFSGVPTAFQRRAEWIGSGQIPSVAELGRYESFATMLPIDTSEWDEALLLSGEGCVARFDLPLGPERENIPTAPRHGEHGGWETILKNDAELCAPIARWAPDIKIGMITTPDTSVVKYIVNDATLPLDPSTSTCVREALMAEEMEGLDDTGSSNTSNKSIEIRHSSPYGDVPLGEHLSGTARDFIWLAQEKHRLEAICASQTHIFSGKGNSNMVKTVFTHCLLARELIPKNAPAIAELAKILVMSSNPLTDGMSDMPISIPLLGKKLVTYGPISIHALEWVEKKPPASAIFSKDGTSLQLKLRIAKLVLCPVSFSYLSQSSAASQLFRKNYKEAPKSRGLQERQPFEGSTGGEITVEIHNMRVKADMVVRASSLGVVAVSFDNADVNIGSLRLHSSLKRINALSFLLNPIIKCVVSREIESALTTEFKLA